MLRVSIVSTSLVLRLELSRGEAILVQRLLSRVSALNILGTSISPHDRDGLDDLIREISGTLTEELGPLTDPALYRV